LPLLDADTLRQLERLSIAHLGSVLTGLTGRRARASGARGLELADYRPYTPGDELRRVDWNIYAPSEGHLAIALLIDGSASMDGGGAARPSKFRYAQRLAATLGAIALLRADAAQAHVLADGEAWAGGRLSTPGSVVPLIEELSDLPRGARTDLPSSVRAYRRHHTDTEVAVLITDGLVESDSLREALEELRRSADSATLVQVIDDSELDVDFRGPVQLRDRETGEQILVEVTAALSRRYVAGFERMAEDAREAARGAGVGYVRALTSVPPLGLLIEAANRAELVAL
jgi:uncharacterized protein (DUF58 family)